MITESKRKRHAHLTAPWLAAALLAACAAPTAVDTDDDWARSDDELFGYHAGQVGEICVWSWQCDPSVSVGCRWGSDRWRRCRARPEPTPPPTDGPPIWVRSLIHRSWSKSLCEVAVTDGWQQAECWNDRVSFRYPFGDNEYDESGDRLIMTDSDLESEHGHRQYSCFVDWEDATAAVLTCRSRRDAANEADARIWDLEIGEDALVLTSDGRRWTLAN